MKFKLVLAKAPLLALLFVSLSFLNQLQAQNSTLTVTGSITDENGKGVPGATIHVKGTRNQTTSDRGA